MKVFVSFLISGFCLVHCAPSTLQTTILPRQYEPDAVQVSRYIGTSNYPGYYVYNYLQIDHGRGIPVGFYADGRPGVTSLQPTYTYYGTPIYDYRYQFNQIFPGFPGYQPPTSIPNGQPSFVPSQGPIFQPTTQRPTYAENDDDDDGIEKLDEKLDPSLEVNDDSSHREEDEDDDSVTIDAI